MPFAELAVVGAGPAGLSAAVTAARLGVKVVLIDEYIQPGGQYLKGETFADTLSSPAERQGRALLRSLPSAGITTYWQTVVWHSEKNRLHLHRPQGPLTLDAATVIAATGARELALPFPGWTLPGVMTVGGIQVLVKAHRVLPGQKILLAGSGPLLLAAAYTLISHGLPPVAVLESSAPRQWMRFGPALGGQTGRMREGWRYLQALRRARVPYRFRRAVVRALGSDHLEAVVTARLDSRGRPVSGSEETIPVDALGIGFGFIPNVDLTQLAGCTHRYAPALGGWVPLVNEHQATDVPGLFAAGECAGVAGAEAALLSGEAAAWGAACHLGRVDRQELAHHLTRLKQARQRQHRFAAVLNTLSSPPDPLLAALAVGDVPICRCEGVTAAAVRQAIDRGARTLDALKTATRVGQGLCQGRTCGPILARLVASQTGCPVEQAGFFRVRPPLKPVPLSTVAAEGVE